MEVRALGTPLACQAMSRSAGQSDSLLTVEHVLRDHMCQGGGYCSVNTEMEVRDLVIFGKAPGESRGTGPADCLTVEHILRDHVSSAPELQYQSVAFQALI